MRKIINYVLLPLLLLSLSVVFAVPSEANESEKALAKSVGSMLIARFQPESINVTISNGGSFAWVDATGAKIEKIRIESMKLRALLRTPPKDADIDDGYSLTKLIMTSQGEIVLLEKDVNTYFMSGVDTRGFSNLRFNFLPTGFKAEGLFSGKFIILIRIRLSANGILALKKDGIYLDNTAIYVEGIKQPESLTNMIINRVNPLLPFSKIPFPVDFNKITMTNDAAIVTHNPEPFKGGETWSWQSKNAPAVKSK